MPFVTVKSGSICPKKYGIAGLMAGGAGAGAMMQLGKAEAGEVD